MSLKQMENIIGSIEQSIENLKRNIPNHLRRASLDLKEAIDSRISETGEFTNTSRVPTTAPYSDGYMKRKTKKIGRAPTIVDLTFSGDMWRNIGVVEESVEDDLFKVSVGARDSENQKKVRFNADRYGDFLDAKEEEVELVHSSYVKNVANELTFLR